MELGAFISSGMSQTEKCLLWHHLDVESEHIKTESIMWWVPRDRDGVRRDLGDAM